jgi:hypothetical protein
MSMIAKIWAGCEGVMSLFWQQEHTFEENLLLFCTKSITKEECVKNCMVKIESLLLPADCDLSEESRKTLESHCQNVIGKVDEFVGCEEDAKGLKEAFKESFCNIIEDKWAAHCAESFHPILSIADKEERIAAARKWIHQFLEGADYFCKWEGQGQYVLHGPLLVKLQKKTSLVFHAHLHDIIQEKMKTFQAHYEENPQFYKDKDPSSLTDIEKESCEIAEITAHCMLSYFPDVDKKCELLKTCIWSGFMLRGIGGNILEPEHFPNSLLEIFNKV